MDIKENMNSIGLDPENTVVIGSGILNALNIRNSNDIDMVVAESAYERLDASGHFKKEMNHREEILADSVFEIGIAWTVLGKRWTFEDLFDKSVLVDGVRYISLQFLLDVKKSWLSESDVRQKDIDDVKLIENYLRN
jgi:hypothetical protein